MLSSSLVSDSNGIFPCGFFARYAGPFNPPSSVMGETMSTSVFGIFFLQRIRRHLAPLFETGTSYKTLFGVGVVEDMVITWNAVQVVSDCNATIPREMKGILKFILLLLFEKERKFKKGLDLSE